MVRKTKDPNETVVESIQPAIKAFPKSMVENKLKAPSVRNVDPLFFTLHGYLSKCFKITPSEQTRILSKYKLTNNSLYMLFSKKGSPQATAKLADAVQRLVGDLHLQSKTAESQKLFNLVHMYFNKDIGTRSGDILKPEKEVPDLEQFEAVHIETDGLVPTKPISPFLEETAASPSPDPSPKKISLTPVDRKTVPKIPLIPALGPVLTKTFGQESIDNHEIAALVDLVYRGGFVADNIDYTTKIFSPIMQVGLVGFMGLFLVRKEKKDQVLNFLEGQLRELSVTAPDQYHSAYAFISRSAQIPLKPAHGPLGFFTYDQMHKLTTLSKSLEPEVAAIYFSVFLTAFTKPNAAYSHPNLKNPISNFEIYILILSILVNIDFGLPKQVIWGDFIQNLNDLSGPAPRVSESCVEVAQP